MALIPIEDANRLSTVAQQRESQRVTQRVRRLTPAPVPPRLTGSMSTDEFLKANPDLFRPSEQQQRDYFEEVDRSALTAATSFNPSPSIAGQFAPLTNLEQDFTPYRPSAIERAIETVGRSGADSFGRVFGGAENFLNIRGGPQIGTAIGEQIERIPGVGSVARTAFDIGASPSSVAVAGVGPTVRAGTQGARGVIPAATRTFLEPVAGSNFATRLGAETALGTGFAVGAEELTERGVPAPIALAGGLATGVGVLGAARGLRAADNAISSQAIRQAEGPLEASTRAGLRPMRGSTSQVADAAEEVLEDGSVRFRGAFHGTGDVVSLNAARAGETTGNPTAQWGVFLSPSRTEAERYVRDFHGGAGSVLASDVTLRKPYRMPFAEFDRFTNLDLGAGDLDQQMARLSREAAVFKDELVQEGFDGIVIGAPGKMRPQEIVAFTDRALGSPSPFPGAVDPVIPGVSPRGRANVRGGTFDGMDEDGLLNALSQRGVKGDDALNKVDLARELFEQSAEIDDVGRVTLYHRTSPEAAAEIRRTGQMVGREDGVFFSTARSGQADGFGDDIVRVSVPVERLELDDAFGSEAHVRIPTSRAGERVRVDVIDDGMPSPGAVDPVIPGVTPRGRARVSGGALDVAEEVPTTSAVFDAPPTVRQLYGTEPIEEGTQRGLGGRLAREGRFAADEPTATPAMLVRDESRRAVTNQATQVQERSRALIDRAGFEFDKQGRIPRLAGIDPDIPGAPTLRDVAARLPKYEPFLTDQQMATLDEIRAMLAPYRQALEEVAEAEARITGKPSTAQVGSRADVMEGGFYIPRGNAATEELAEIALRRGGRGPGRGKQGFEKSATFASEAEGIAAGYEYTPIADALGGYVRGIGNRTLDRHAANYFLSRTDEAGQRLAQSAADRVDPKLRGDVQSLRAKITGRLQTLRGQTTRGRAQAGEAARSSRTAERLDELAGNAAERAQDARVRRTSTEVLDTADDITTARTVVDDTDGVLKAADRELRILETQARQADSRATSAGARASRTEAARQATIDEIDRLRAEYDELNQRWQVAQAQARSTPRDRGRIQLPGLEGQDFPWEVADEANRILQREQNIKNAGTVLRVVNGILRGVQATGEMSYLGIQGAVALASGNRAWRRAAKVATKAWGSENALGDAIRTFDARAAKTGRPTAEQWAANGVRLAGGNTEFAVSVPQGAVRGVTKALRVPEAADRGFGAFGDTVRLELADILADESLAAGRTLDAAEMKRIAQTVNRVSGFSQTRAAGDWGELLNFAPRYLAARIESLGQLASKDKRKRQLARRLIGRYIGIASLMTIAVNTAMGNETDFRPFSGSKGPTWNPLDAEYKNPNFFRVRALGRDWSFLGPVDSTLGVFIGASSMLTNPSGDPKEALNRLRSVFTSPLASMGLDWLVFGEDFDRNALNNGPAIARDLMHRIVPFAVPELIETGFDTADAIEQGDVGAAASEVVGGVAQAGVGFRGTPMTVSERVRSGGYESLRPEDQFNGIAAQSWVTVQEGLPEELKPDVEGFTSLFQWREQTVEEWTRAYIEQGHSPTDSRREAERQVERSPIYRYYLQVKDYFETEWYTANPELGRKHFEEQMKLPSFDRRNMPTQEQLQVIADGLAAQEQPATPAQAAP